MTTIKMTVWLEFKEGSIPFAPSAREQAMKRAAVREIEAAQNGSFDGDHGAVVDYFVTAEATDETVSQERLRCHQSGIYPYG